MPTTETKLDNLLEDIHELEDFLHALIPALDKQKLRQGDDVLRYAKDLKLKIPKSISGLDITWESDTSISSHQHGRKDSESVVLVRSGDLNMVGLTLGCIRVGKWKICIECSWILCRIVVTRRF